MSGGPIFWPKGHTPRTEATVVIEVRVPDPDEELVQPRVATALRAYADDLVSDREIPAVGGRSYGNLRLSWTAVFTEANRQTAVAIRVMAREVEP